METLLGAKGPLARQLPGFTPRPQQIALAQGVERALVDGRACLAEAGTGTGKTVGYLLPLFRWLHRHGGRAVVSTHTLALQAQLVERDIPALMAALPDLEIRPAVLKGRTNYLCLQDLENASADIQYAGDPQFLQIQRWSNETDSGEVAELDFSFPGWFDIAANADTCHQRECRYYERCFYYKARKTAEEANLLVVNHSLFFADLRLRRMAPGIPHLLPPYDAVVFDEAHHVEDIATRAFGLEWGSRRVPQLLYKLKRVPDIDSDRLRLVETLHDALTAPFLGAPKAEAFVDEALAGDGARSDFLHIRDELCAHLNATARDLTKIADSADAPADRDRAGGLARTTTRISTELKQVTKPDVKEEDEEDGVGYFRWYHTRKTRGGQPHSTLVRTPLTISKLVRETLLAETPRTVLVSATLTTSGGFDYLKGRLGMDDEESTPPVEVREGSPFDYGQNCLLYVPRTLGGPVGGYGAQGGGEAYADILADELLALIEAARGRTFVLFTSNRMLRAMHERLWDRCEWPLFVQGEMPNGRLVEEFVKCGEGVLLGTNSFWEGVDVPGPALSLVVIDKLPFAAPDSPTQRAREQHIKANGGDSFRDLSLPLAQMRLKQGFGRLLRTVNDRGVVAVLDSRLWTKGYGREMMADLPACPRTADRRDVERFFAAERLAAVTAAVPVVASPKEKVL
jgi:ATP-dependent DNA helicase DinG